MRSLRGGVRHALAYLSAVVFQSDRPSQLWSKRKNGIYTKYCSNSSSTCSQRPDKSDRLPGRLPACLSLCLYQCLMLLYSFAGVRCWMLLVSLALTTATQWLGEFLGVRTLSSAWLFGAMRYKLFCLSDIITSPDSEHSPAAFSPCSC